MTDPYAAYRAGDYAEALRRLKPLAEKGDAQAQALLGYMCQMGQGVAKDMAAAAAWYRKAAEQGEATACYNLAGLCRAGQGISRDYAEALRWLERAAQLGHKEASGTAEKLRLYLKQQGSARTLPAGEFSGVTRGEGSSSPSTAGTRPLSEPAPQGAAQTMPLGSAGSSQTPGSAKPSAPDSAEAGVPAEWNVGDVILGLYEVKALLGEGGMGKVFRVRHRGWNVDLAVKTPRAEMLQSPDSARNFAAEAETWINLGLHPHAVSCHYVRVLGGIPRVFAECVEGGASRIGSTPRSSTKGGRRRLCRGCWTSRSSSRGGFTSRTRRAWCTRTSSPPT